MSERWLEIENGSGTTRVPLAGTVTRIGGSAADVMMAGLPAGELHLWSDPPKVILVAGDDGLVVNGVAGREALLADGDLIEWGAARIVFRAEVGGAVLEEIGGQVQPAPVAASGMAPAPAPGAAPTPAAYASPAALPGAAAAPSSVPSVPSGAVPSGAMPSGAMPSGEVPSGAAGVAWARVRAGLIVDLGLADKRVVKGWQESVSRGDFAPDACARDVASGLSVDGDDRRLVERSGRLLRDFLMASTMAGSGGAKRKARQAGKRGAAMLISQLIVSGMHLLLILAVLFILRAKWGEEFQLQGLFDFFDSLLGRR